MIIASPYIDSLLGVLLICLATSVATLPLGAHLTGYQGLGRALTLTAALGVSLLTFIASILYYIFPPTVAAFMSFSITLMIGGLTWWRSIDRVIRLPYNLPQLALGMGVTVLILFGFIANRLSVLFPDEPIHLSLSATIAAGNYPVKLPWAPDSPAAYHYAADLHVSLLTAITQLPVGITAEFQHAWLSLGLIFAVFGIARHATHSTPASLFIAMLTSFAPGVLWIGWPALAPQNAAIPTSFNAMATWFGEDQFQHADLLAGPANIFFPQRILGLALSTIVVWAWVQRVHSTRIGALLLGASLGFIALVEIGIFAVTGAALATLLLLEAIRSKPECRIRSAIQSVIVLLSALLIAALIGGPITDAIWRGSGEGSIEISPHFDTSLLDPRIFSEPLHSGLYAIAVGLTWIHLLAIALAVLMLCRQRVLLGLIVAGVSGGILVQVLVYTVHDDAARLVDYSSYFLALGSAIGAYSICQQLPRRIVTAVIPTLIIFVILPTVLPRIAPGIRNTANGIDWGPPDSYLSETLRQRSHYYKDISDNRQVFDWITENLPPDARILSPTPVALTIATGRFGVFTAVGHNQNEPYPGLNFIHAWETLDGPAIQAMGATHLHIRDLDFSNLPPEALSRLEDRDLFQLIFTGSDISSSSTAQRLYRIQSRTLDQHPSPHITTLLDPSRGILLGDGLTDFSTAALSAALLEYTVLRDGEIPGHLRSPAQRGPLKSMPGYALYPEWYLPADLRLSQDDAIWSGAGAHLFDLTSTLEWQGPLRPGSDQLTLNLSAERTELLIFVLGNETLEIKGDLTDYELTGGLTRLSVSGNYVRFKSNGGITSPFVFYRGKAPKVAVHTTAGIVVDAGWDGTRFITNLLWDSSNTENDTLGAEWVLVPKPGSTTDPPRPDRPNLVRWESALNVRATADIVQETFDPVSLTPSFLDPVKASMRDRPTLTDLTPGRYQVFLYIVERTVEARRPVLAIPVFSFSYQTPGDSVTSIFTGKVDPTTPATPVWRATRY